MAAILKPVFDRIKTPQITAADKARLASNIAAVGNKWSSSAFDWYKTWLITELRKLQKHKCCYCRRVILFNKGAREIEHIVDKGKHPDYMFEVGNLALACKDCNNNKGVKSVLAPAFKLVKGAPYPTDENSYLWVHPHLHKYSAHIIIHQGWVYEAKDMSPQGGAVITKCKLNDLEALESKNRVAFICAAQTLESAVDRASGLVDEAGIDRICREVAPVLSALWTGKSSKTIDDAIRRAHSNVKKIV